LKLFPGKKKGEILQLNIPFLLVFFIFWRNSAPQKKTLGHSGAEEEKREKREKVSEKFLKHNARDANPGCQNLCHFFAVKKTH